MFDTSDALQIHLVFFTYTIDWLNALDMLEVLLIHLIYYWYTLVNLVYILDNDTLGCIIHILNNNLMNCIRFEKKWKNHVVSILMN